MAIAPVNKFISIAVPVAPGEQKLYEVPTGTSAILLYAQVSNVGVGTYPTVSFIHRRETRSTSLTRDIRIIKDIEIPPNDAAILVDGRLILEKTPLIVDRLFIQSTQTGITTISNVDYDEPTGIATVTTMGLHGFNANDQITLAGIAFTCPSGSGITTTVFPDPQASYVVDSIVDAVGTSKTFTSVLGSATGIKHTYVPSVHTFVRAKQNSVTSNAGVKYTPEIGTNYNPSTGYLELKITNHGIISSPSTHQVSAAKYTPRTGIMTCTVNSHGFATGNLVRFADNSLTFTCAMDGNSASKTYPRSTDPASGKWHSITFVDSNNFSVNVGPSPIKGHGVSTCTYNSTNGNLVLTIGANHGLTIGESVKIANNSLSFRCAQDSYGSVKTYPRASGQGGASSNDPIWNDACPITAVDQSNGTITINALQGTSPTNTTAHQFVSANNTYTPESGTSYDPATGILTVKVTGHGFINGEHVKFDDESLKFSCTQGNQSGVNSERNYPRASDPASDKWLTIYDKTADTFKVNVLIGTSPTNTTVHSFKSAVANSMSRAIVSSGGEYVHSTGTGSAGGMERTANHITIADNALTFTCTMDNNGTEHTYPRSTDPASSTNLVPVSATTNTITVDVGTTNAGGQSAPLQMEFIASILENSSA